MRGHKEKGSIKAPIDLVIQNEIDASTWLDVINGVPHLRMVRARQAEPAEHADEVLGIRR